MSRSYQSSDMPQTLSRDQQIRNLGLVGGRKLARLLDMARKQGQIRELIYNKKGFTQMFNKKIEKEYQDLDLIISDLVAMGVNLQV